MKQFLKDSLWLIVFAIAVLIIALWWSDANIDIRDLFKNIF